jgi:ectoine hydroxylase-related dioxygenase (phytanoyl-CoA dioxygenase family)
MPDRDQSRGEFPWHQDEGNEPVEPALGVTVWIALDDMTLENGCIWVVPQSHKQGHLPHEARGGDGFLTLPIEGDGEPMPMKAGKPWHLRA